MAAKRPTVVVTPDRERDTYTAETWTVAASGFLSLIADGEEVATFHPDGWRQVYLLDAQARP